MGFMNNQPQGKQTTTRFPDYNQAAEVLRGLPSEPPKTSSPFFTVSPERDLRSEWLGMCAQLRKII